MSDMDTQLIESIPIPLEMNVNYKLVKENETPLRYINN